MRRVCVFCGSSPGTDPVYLAGARGLAAELVARDLGLVYGGGDIGLMGAVADAVLAAGGEAIGVIPEQLAALEVAHDGLTELHVVHSMHARKKMMFDLADGFVAMPGGLGTFEEILEVLTWAQLGMHGKPCALLDVAGYWAPLVQLLDQAAAQGFVASAHRALLLRDAEPGPLLDAMCASRPRRVPRWIDGEAV